MKALTSLLMIASVTYLLLCVVIYFYQGRMVFLAHMPGRELTASPENIGLAYENVTIDTKDGEQIHGWYIPSDQSKGTVLFFHGNAGNISHRLDSISVFNRLGLDVLIVDYRGYGQSTGKPGERGLYLDGEAAWLYLTDQRGIDPGRIIVFGRSMGGVVGASVAANRSPAGLIIESSFTSGVDMARRLYRFLPAKLITRLEFPLIDFVQDVSVPTLVIHSRDDEIVPFDMGEQIFEAIEHQDKTFLEIWGGHNTGFYLSEAVYVPALVTFVEKSLAPVD
ncbi:MAG TPA: alpha/beta hydrolase [Xanthomonadales bacterium]|nr:alpha/beta hydrolase [Xanthomonadales bacterium]